MANKRQRKKQMKKQMEKMKALEAKQKLQEEVKEAEPVELNDEVLSDNEKPWLNPVLIETERNIEKAELYLGKYEAENKEYQALLDKRYPEGRIKPVERYVTQDAIILHHCSKCNQEFYGKPKWMLGADHQKHICTMPYGNSYGERLASVSTIKNRKKKGTLNINQFYEMVWNDYTYKEIAQTLKINPDIVEDYFKSNGLI
ncbi:hypothetical protein [Halobacillus ihumii]|uniref:hypothetical protein n=1 Tax=Halobacillus ihumii TaxID=2686092 RepID=UPI0013D30107|nr:hypothetical protein [Halobacillus ihumii]